MFGDMNPLEPNETAPRFYSDEAFPPYTYIPGRTPHPESNQAGHSFGRKRLASPAIDPARWRESWAYLRGLDLFNAGYYWESHVEFESLWLAAGRKGPVADFLKVLIHLAACGVKHLEGKPAGVASHVRRVVQLVRELQGRLNQAEPVPFGISLKSLLEMATSIEAKGWPGERPKILPVPSAT